MKTAQLIGHPSFHTVCLSPTIQLVMGSAWEFWPFSYFPLLFFFPNPSSSFQSSCCLHNSSLASTVFVPPLLVGFFCFWLFLVVGCSDFSPYAFICVSLWNSGFLFPFLCCRRTCIVKWSEIMVALYVVSASLLSLDAPTNFPKINCGAGSTFWESQRSLWIVHAVQLSWEEPWINSCFVPV